MRGRSEGGPPWSRFEARTNVGLPTPEHRLLKRLNPQFFREDFELIQQVASDIDLDEIRASLKDFRRSRSCQRARTDLNRGLPRSSTISNLPRKNSRMIKLSNAPIGGLHLSKFKSFIQAPLIVGTLLALLSSAGEPLGQAAVPSNPFVDLLVGVYQPVVHAPNLGLSQVDLNDGSYSQVPIYDVSGIPGTKLDKPVGTFYVQFNGNLCAYHYPGGSLSAIFLNMIGDTTYDPDGSWTFVGTEDLDILEGTGIYRPFAGGHIHMVDVLKFNAVEARPFNIKIHLTVGIAYRILYLNY